MFKFSLEWLKDYIGKDIKFNELLKILNLQGFEFQGEQKVGNDIITAIEVKANRPDMLSHMGIAREIKAFNKEKIPTPKKYNKKVFEEDFPIDIKVESLDICSRFCGVIIENIDNKVQTPEYIRRRLEALGINCVNAVVDIANYIMLDMGQPMHSYDIEKISGKELTVKKAKNKCEMITLGEKPAFIEPGDIIICDSENTLCAAGIIGFDIAAVTPETSDVLLEGAVFNEVDIRLTSRRLKISTPSSFRFERGINVSYTPDILMECAKKIAEVCGGKIKPQFYDFYPSPKPKKIIDLNISRACSLLGMKLSADKITSYLEKYGFECALKSEDIIGVTVPCYRLDVKQEVDITEEIARIHGYDNIPAVMPVVMTGYQKNEIWSRMDKIRKNLIGLGFNETINYSFIPNNTMKMLGISVDDDIYSDLSLQNPIAGAYALMRPTLAYSMVNCLAYNYSIGNSNLGLFELGRVYFKDKNCDKGCRETDTCAFIMSGTRTPRGWGSSSDISYTYYDLLNYVKILFDDLGQSFELKSNSYEFFEKGSGYDIICGNKKAGFIGELCKSKINKITNAKLIKDKIFYCEFYLKNIKENAKKISFESKYPPITRLYNFVQKKNITSKQVMEVICSSNEIVRNVIVKDIYFDKTFDESEYAVLYEVTYCSKTSTLTATEAEGIEISFLNNLSKKFDIKLKK